MDKIILFHTTNQAMWAEDCLKDNKIESKMGPVPREFSSDCGYCVKFNGNIEDVEKILNNEGIEFDRILEI